MTCFSIRAKKLRLFVRVLAMAAGVIALKFFAHWQGWEVISLNPLFSGIVAANVFLMGFLLSGVLSDYREAERLPGELACSLKIIADDARTVLRTKQTPATARCLDHLRDLATSTVDWLHKRRSTQEVMGKLDQLHDDLVDFESVLQPNYVIRLKQEQSSIRRILTRIHTVRETSFISAGYLLAEVTTMLLILGLILSKIDPFLESLFFVGVISFLLFFLHLLVRDLDNPFGYYERNSAEDVSLQPLEYFVKTMEAQQPHVEHTMLHVAKSL